MWGEGLSSCLVDAEGEPAHALSLSELPAVPHVGRGVKLGQHPHPPHPGVLNDVPDDLGGVHLPKQGGGLQKAFLNKKRM
jgi:hypothetical protein